MEKVPPERDPPQPVRAVGARHGGGTSPTVPAVGQGQRGGGKPCPHRLVAIVIRGTITIGVFGGGLEMFFTLLYLAFL